MEFEDVLDAWRVNNKITLELLALCPDESLDFKPGKGKTIRSNFVHIAWCRGEHVKDKVPKAKDQVPKLDWKTATRDEIVQALTTTGELMETVLTKRFEKPDRYTGMRFFAYMIAHEAHHRSQVDLALRLNGAEPDETKLYDLWQWEKK